MAARRKDPPGLEAALRACLASKAAWEVEPSGLLEALQNAKVRNALQLEPLVRRLLKDARRTDPKWVNISLDQEMKLLGARMRGKHPTFSESTIDRLENYYALFWK